MLRHFLAALAYRTQKALRDMPEGFPRFRPGSKVRNPHQLICHMTNVLGYGRTFFIGGSFPSRTPTDFNHDLEAFHEMLADLSDHLDRGTPLHGTSEERLLQGPFADAMTHAGQLALLRRLAGSPVPPENFIMADISANNVGTDQRRPVAPDAEWPERPSDSEQRMIQDLSLRNVVEDDLPLFFEFQLDPDANSMAAFIARDPTDREAFTAHWKKILANPTNIIRTIVCDGQVVGSVSSYLDAGKPEVTYWIGRAHWGKGVATRALTDFLTQANTTRPIYARVAKDNLGSRRVLEKCGFQVIGQDRGFAKARGEEIEELHLELRA